MAYGDTYNIPVYGTEGNHSYEKVLDSLRDALDRAGTLVHLDPSCRAVLWLAAISRLAAADPRSVLEELVVSLQQHRSWDHPYKDSFRALVDSRMFVEIVEQLLPDLSTTDLRDLISGNFDPALDQPSNRARDREFELFIAAICRRAGLPVRLAEPDIVFEVGGASQSVAAKRLSSIKNVAHNLRRAAEQIEESGMPGIVFLDVTRILDPAYVVVTHERSVHQTVGGPLLHFVKTEFNSELRKKRNDYVQGIVLRVAFPHVSRGFKYGTYETAWFQAIDGVDRANLERLIPYLLKGADGS